MHYSIWFSKRGVKSFFFMDIKSIQKGREKGLLLSQPPLPPLQLVPPPSKASTEKKDSLEKKVSTSYKEDIQRKTRLFLRDKEWK